MFNSYIMNYIMRKKKIIQKSYVLCVDYNMRFKCPKV